MVYCMRGSQRPDCCNRFYYSYDPFPKRIQIGKSNRPNQWYVKRVTHFNFFPIRYIYKYIQYRKNIDFNRLKLLSTFEFFEFKCLGKNCITAQGLHIYTCCSLHTVKKIITSCHSNVILIYFLHLFSKINLKTIIKVFKYMRPFTYTFRLPTL